MAKEEEEDGGGGEEEELTHSCVFCFGKVIASPVAKEASFYARMTSSMCGQPISIWSGFLFRGVDTEACGGGTSNSWQYHPESSSCHSLTGGTF